MTIKTVPYPLCGLDYVYVIVPVKRTADGTEYIDLPMNVIERAIAIKLIEERVPIRGAEVRFLRAALGITLREWAKLFGFSAAGVNKWEKTRTKRLAPVNEAAIRALCAERLDVGIEGKWSDLVATAKVPKRLSLRIDSAA